MDDQERARGLTDSISIALLAALESMPPPERLAFVLRDMFGMPYDEIGPIVGRSPAAAQRLVTRARHRARGVAPRMTGG